MVARWWLHASHVHGLSGFPCALHAIFETLKSNHDDTEVIERLKSHCFYKQCIDSIAARLVELHLTQLHNVVLCLSSACSSPCILTGLNSEIIQFCSLATRFWSRILWIRLNNCCSDGIPNFLASYISTQPIENSIAPQKNVVMTILLYVDVMYFRVNNNYVGISIVFF